MKDIDVKINKVLRRLQSLDDERKELLSELEDLQAKQRMYKK